MKTDVDCDNHNRSVHNIVPEAVPKLDLESLKKVVSDLKNGDRCPNCLRPTKMKVAHSVSTKGDVGVAYMVSYCSTCLEYFTG